MFAEIPQGRKYLIVSFSLTIHRYYHNHNIEVNISFKKDGENFKAKPLKHSK